MISNLPSVSIITPFFNASHYVTQFVRSMKCQNYTNWVCLLIDDHSTDNSNLILKSLISDDSRFLLYKNPEQHSSTGPASARNYALSLVNSDLVAFCDIDDLWHPSKLEIQVEALITHNADIVVSDYTRFRITSRPSLATVDVHTSPTCTYYGLLRRNLLPLLTVLISSRMLTARFPLIHHEDYLYWLSIYKDNPDINYYCVPKVLAYYRVHSSNITSNKLLMSIWTFKVFRKHGFGRIHSLIRIIIWSASHLCAQTITNLTKLNHLKSPSISDHPHLSYILSATISR